MLAEKVMIRAAPAAWHAGAHVLVLGQGTGILALLAAQAGTGRVSCVERSRMLYRMAQQAVAANARAPNAGSITVLPLPLASIRVAGAAVTRPVPFSVQPLDSAARLMQHLCTAAQGRSFHQRPWRGKERLGRSTAGRREGSAEAGGVQKQRMCMINLQSRYPSALTSSSLTSSTTGAPSWCQLSMHLSCA